MRSLTLLMPVAQPQSAEQPDRAMQHHAHETLRHAAPPPAPGLMSEKQQEGWSPSKIESLNFFLASTAKPAASTAPRTVLPPQAPPAGVIVPGSSSSALAVSGEAQRPYLGLKYLLQSGPGGAGAPKTWSDLHPNHRDPQLRKQTDARAQPPGGSRSGAAPSGSSSRFAPYSLPPSRPGRSR